MTVQGSARESLHWLDWFVRVRRALLVGACCSAAGGAALVYVGLRMHGIVTAAALLFSLAAPCLVLVAMLLKALAVASAMAHALHQREHQLASARRELTRRGEHHEGGDVTPAPDGRGEQGPEALGSIARDLREPLQLIESNVAVLSEAFGDILPVLDQHEAAGPHIRVARLEYPFFRERVPVILRDLASGTARIAGLTRALAAPARHVPRTESATPASAR